MRTPGGRNTCIGFGWCIKDMERSNAWVARKKERQEKGPRKGSERSLVRLLTTRNREVATGPWHFLVVWHIGSSLRQEFLRKIPAIYILSNVHFLVHASIFTHFNQPLTIACVRYIPTWLQGFRVKVANFSLLYCLAIPRRVFSTKKTKQNCKKRPESLGVMLEF